MRHPLQTILAVFLVVGLASAWFAPARAAEAKPNIVLIFADDLGYGDVGCYGATKLKTPNIDRLASQGRRFTDAHSASAVCTPSRYALLSGEYPFRREVWGPAMNQSALLIDPDKTTLADLLKGQGYATACIGKWHLGFGSKPKPDWNADLKPGPLELGFDYYFGLPVVSSHPPFVLIENHRVLGLDPADPLVYGGTPPTTPYPEKMLRPGISGGKAAHALYKDDQLGTQFSAKAVSFIREHRDGPFFLMLSHAMPGSTPHPFASPAFKGKSRNGAWGDSVEEIDWSTGEILAALKRLGIARDTIVIWMSDNGAPRRQTLQGSNAPLKGWGYGTSEGGMRVPCLVRWLGRVPAGRVCSELATSLDLLPTLAGLAGVKPPADRIIDGRDIAPLLLGQPNARSPHEAFYYYHVEQLQAVRSGPHKLYLPLENMLTLGSRKPVRQEPALYDLAADIGETHNLLDKHPDVVARLTALAERAREDLGDRGQAGKNRRPAGHEPAPTPRTIRRE